MVAPLKTMTKKEAMWLAVQEGRKGAGFVSPNPLVGCVILDEKMRFLSSGYHKTYGGAHAEIEALKGVSEEQLEGAHLFVTLEPCAHEGKTASCAKHLASLPIASVTYGIQDPNPLTNGKGAAILKKANKDVFEFSELKNELEELPEIFLQNQRNQMPFVALKVATSLDGQMGLKNGQSQWITNELSQEYAHFLRAVHGCVLVGRNTINIDDPRLNIRHPKFKDKSNKVVILDSEGQLLENIKNKKVYQSHKPEDLIFVVKEGRAPKSSEHVIIENAVLPEGMFDLKSLLKKLFEMGIVSVMVEGGSQTYKSFFIQKEIQRLIHFQAPILLGAENGLPWTQGLFIPDMKSRIILKDGTAQFFGSDLMTTARLA